jgi:hypothetical protein
VATRESAIAALAFDPRGSLLVNGNRYGLDGSYLGAVLQAGGDPVIDTDGRIWLAGATSVAGYDEDGRQFSMAGEDCLIGGGLDPPSCWGGVGAFQGTPRLSARPGGGVVATDPAADRVQELDAQGRLLAACTHLLPTPVEAAARTPSTLLLAAGTAIYALADPECPKPPLRFERVRFTRRARSRWRLSFALTRPAHILVTLRRRDIVAQREYASRHRRRIDLRRCDGGCLPHGRWQVIVRAVDARGNEADVPWRTIPL